MFTLLLSLDSKKGRTRKRCKTNSTRLVCVFHLIFCEKKLSY